MSSTPTKKVTSCSPPCKGLIPAGKAFGTPVSM
jgi:hypothetical protein